MGNDGDAHQHNRLTRWIEIVIPFFCNSVNLGFNLQAIGGRKLLGYNVFSIDSMIPLSYPYLDFNATRLCVLGANDHHVGSKRASFCL